MLVGRIWWKEFESTPGSLSNGANPEGTSQMAVMKSIRWHEFDKWRIGSPVWIRFELLRANWHCDRTSQPVYFLMDRRGMPSVVHDGSPAWTSLELTHWNPIQPWGTAISRDAALTINTGHELQPSVGWVRSAHQVRKQ